MGRVKPQDKRAEYVQERFELSRRVMEAHHQKWLETLFGVQGEHGLVYWHGRLINADERARILKNRRNDPYQELVTVSHNFLLTTHQTLVGAATQNLPKPTTALLRSDHAAMQAKRYRDALLRYLVVRRGSRFEEAEQRAVAWAIITGTGWFGALWDQLAGQPQFVPERTEDGDIKLDARKAVMLRSGEAAWKQADGIYTTSEHWPHVERIADRFEDLDVVESVHGTPLTSDELVPQGQFQSLGDLVFWAPNPFDLFFEVTRDWESLPGFIHRQIATREEVVDTYGSKARDIEATVRPEDMLSFDVLDDPEAREETGKHVLILSRFERPSTKHPGGRYIVVAGGKTVHSGSLPGGRYPMHPIYDTEHPGRLLGWSRMAQALAPQRNINALESDFRAHFRFHAHPRMVAEAGSLENGVTRVPSQPGAILQVSKNARKMPDFLRAPMMPAHAAQEPRRLQRAIEDVTGVHGVTQGDSSGIQSGRQAAVHQAADARKWAPLIRSLARAVADQSELALNLWRVYAPQQHRIQVFGPNLEALSTLDIDKRILEGEIAVQVQSAAMMPYNEEIRRQVLSEQWQIGTIRSLDEFWARYGDGPLNEHEAPQRAHSRQRAEEEIELMLQGRQVLAQDFEHHGVHIDILLVFMRSPEFYRLSPMVRAIFAEHYRQHVAFMQPQPNPVLTGDSPMPQIGDAGGGAGRNMAPSLTSPGQQQMPGLNAQEEAGYVQ